MAAQKSALPVDRSVNESMVIDSTFTLAAAPLETYTGIYRNNLPYSGYFKTGTRNFFWVIFYAQGRKSVRYSYDFLEDVKQREEEEIFQNKRKILPFKATFRDDKLVNGYTYTLLPIAILPKKPPKRFYI